MMSAVRQLCTAAWLITSVEPDHQVVDDAGQRDAERGVEPGRALADLHHVHGDHDVGAHAAQDSDRNRIARDPVDEALISDRDRREDAVHGRRGHDRFRERAGAEVHGLAAVEIGGREQRTASADLRSGRRHPNDRVGSATAADSRASPVVSAGTSGRTRSRRRGRSSGPEASRRARRHRRRAHRQVHRRWPRTRSRSELAPRQERPGHLRGPSRGPHRIRARARSDIRRPRAQGREQPPPCGTDCRLRTVRPTLTHQVEGRVTDRDDAVGTGQRVGGARSHRAGSRGHWSARPAPRRRQDPPDHTPRPRTATCVGLPDRRRAARQDDRPLTQQRRARLRKIGPELGRGRGRTDPDNDGLTPNRTDVDGVTNARAESIRERGCDPRAELRIHADQQQEVHMVETPQRRAGLRDRLRSARDGP